MESIEAILKREFPELEVDVPSIPGTSNIKPEELTNALQYIRNNRLVQDSDSLLTETKPLRSSVAYPIIFPQQYRELSFKVNWIQGPMVYIGYIQTPNHLGEDIPQARFYGMRIKNK